MHKRTKWYFSGLQEALKWLKEIREEALLMQAMDDFDHTYPNGYPELPEQDE